MMSVRLCNNNCNDRDGNDGVDGTEGQAKMSKDGNNMFLDAERTDLNRALTSMNVRDVSGPSYYTVNGNTISKFFRLVSS